MKKLSLGLIALTFLLVNNTFSQFIKEENIEFNKKIVPAISIEVPDLDAKTTYDALRLFMEKQGLKGTKMKSFYVYLNQPFSKISQENLDIYTLVSSKGSKKAPRTFVYFFHSKGNENFIDSKTEPEEITNVKELLKEFIPFSTEYALSLKIKAKEVEINKIEKDLASLTKSINKQNKQKEKIDKNLKKLQTDSATKNLLLIKAKEELEVLRKIGQ